MADISSVPPVPAQLRHNVCGRWRCRLVTEVSCPFEKPSDLLWATPDLATVTCGKDCKTLFFRRLTNNEATGSVQSSGPRGAAPIRYRRGVARTLQYHSPAHSMLFKAGVSGLRCAKPQSTDDRCVVASGSALGCIGQEAETIVDSVMPRHQDFLEQPRTAGTSILFNIARECGRRMPSKNHRSRVVDGRFVAKCVHD